MDEHIRKTRFSRNLILSAAILAAPATTLGEETVHGSPLRAHLTSGFGAGTYRTADARLASPKKRPTRVAVVRPAAKVLGLTETNDVSGDDPHPVIRSLEPSPNDGALPRLPKQVRSLAELIRESKQEADAVQPMESGEETSPDAESDRSIHVELAPTVRRIAVGTFVPGRSERVDPNAVVRMANPVDARLYPTPKAKLIQVPKLPNEGTEPKLPVPVRPTPNDEAAGSQDNFGAISRLAPVEESSKLSASIDAFLPNERVSDGLLEPFSTGSRRFADLSGLDLLPLNQLGEN